MARPRGWALGSVSGIWGRPVEEEKRRVRGVEGWVKCGAVVRVEARGVGVKVPVRRVPRAWAGGRGVSGMQDGNFGKRTCAEAVVFAEEGVELRYEVAGCLDEFFVGWERHDCDRN